jgi:hypothetical protein
MFTRLNRSKSQYVNEPRNILANGLTLVQINPQRAVNLQKESATYGWLFYPGPEIDQWVTLRKLSPGEIDEANDQASDMTVLDCDMGGVEIRSRSGGARWG